MKDNPLRHRLTDEEQEKLAELIAIKVADRYTVLMKEHVDTQILLHSAQCAAGKLGWLKSFFSAVSGGVLVGVIMWLITR